jgi:hypothetical protein
MQVIERRWADKFCLHCNIFIYVRHIWIKPVLCSRMVSLFHQHTDAYRPHPVHIEMELSSSSLFYPYFTGIVFHALFHTSFQCLYSASTFLSLSRNSFQHLTCPHIFEQPSNNFTLFYLAYFS